MLNTVRNIVDSRISEGFSEGNEEEDDDMLSKMVKDMGTVEFLTPAFLTQLLFSFSFATYQSVSPLLAFAVKFLTENPAVLPELIVSEVLPVVCVCVCFDVKRRRFVVDRQSMMR